MPGCSRFLAGTTLKRVSIRYHEELIANARPESTFSTSPVLLPLPNDPDRIVAVLETRQAAQSIVFPLKNDIPVRRVPVVTWVLLVANVLAFAWQAWFALRITGLLHARGLPFWEFVRRFDQGISYTALIGGAIPWEIVTFRDIGPRDLVPPRSPS